MAFPLAPIRRIICWINRRAAPLCIVFLVRGHREDLRGAPPHRNTCRSCEEMERGDQLRRALHGQARGVSPGVGDGQDLGGMEQGTPPRQVEDGRGQPQGHLPDQEDIQEASEEEGQWLLAAHYCVRKA